MDLIEAAEMKTLEQLYASHEGKVSDKWSFYLEAYDEYFREFRQKPINVLEIGAQNGGSLELWSQYFPNARTIVGVDVDPACADLSFDDPRIKLLVGDAGEPETHERVKSAIGEDINVIIDDGSHNSADIIKCFSLYFPELAKGGTYIMEDLHCSYWNEYNGGLYFPFSSISFTKRLVDVINYQHWRNNITRAEFLEAFSQEFGVSFNEQQLSLVDSVEFLNSLVVVRKSRWKADGLGERRVVGLSGQVVDSNQLITQSPTELKQREPDEAGFANESIELAYRRMELELADLQARNEILRNESAELRMASDVAHARVTEIENSRIWRATVALRSMIDAVRGR